jgi:DNA-binding MarR family transcriptional regulator
VSPRGEDTPKRGSGTRAQQSVRLWLRLLSLHNLVEGHVRRRLGERFGRTLPQFDVLAELDFAGEPQTMSQVSRRLMVSNGNLTGVVERLVREGLVHREVSAHDRRAQLLSLSAEGQRQFRAMAAEHAAWVQDLFGELPREALDDAVGGMHALRNLVRTRTAPASDGSPPRKRSTRSKQP